MIKVRDDKLGCARLRCSKYDNGSNNVYWCCHGCDEPDCKDRCSNSRDRCNIGTETNVVGTKIELVDAAAAYELWRAGKLKKTEAARRCGMAWSSFWRYAKERMEAEDE